MNLKRYFSPAPPPSAPGPAWHHARIILQDRNADDRPTAADYDILDGVMNRHGYKRYMQDNTGDWYILLPGEYMKSIDSRANPSGIETDFDTLARTIGWPCLIFATVTISWMQICLRRLEPSTVAILERDGWM